MLYSLLYLFARQILINKLIGILNNQKGDSYFAKGILPHEIATTKDEKPANYSAAATAQGIFVQKALPEANNLNYVDITKAFEHGKYNIFYQN